MNKIEKTTKDDLLRFYNSYIDKKMPAIVTISKPTPEQIKKLQENAK